MYSERTANWLYMKGQGRDRGEGKEGFFIVKILFIFYIKEFPCMERCVDGSAGPSCRV